MFYPEAEKPNGVAFDFLLNLCTCGCVNKAAEIFE